MGVEGGGGGEMAQIRCDCSSQLQSVYEHRARFSQSYTVTKLR